MHYIAQCMMREPRIEDGPMRRRRSWSATCIAALFASVSLFPVAGQDDERLLVHHDFILDTPLELRPRELAEPGQAE